MHFLPHKTLLGFRCITAICLSVESSETIGRNVYRATQTDKHNFTGCLYLSVIILNLTHFDLKCKTLFDCVLLFSSSILKTT